MGNFSEAFEQNDHHHYMMHYGQFLILGIMGNFSEAFDPLRLLSRILMITV